LDIEIALGRWKENMGVVNAGVTSTLLSVGKGLTFVQNEILRHRGL